MLAKARDVIREPENGATSLAQARDARMERHRSLKLAMQEVNLILTQLVKASLINEDYLH